MTDIHAALSRKVAGLPAGAWAAALIGGIGVSWYLRNRAASTDSYDTTGDTIAPTTAETDGMGGAAVSDPANPGQVSNPAPGAGGPGTGQAIRNNNQWRQQMVKVMVGNGITPLFAERAVHDYLAGNALTEKQAQALNHAMATVGPPPLPTPRSTVKHPPPPKPKPKPKPKPHKPPKKKHHPVAHNNDKPHRHHGHPKPHPHARRDTGTHTNPGR